MSLWHVVQFVDGVLPAAWQAAHPGGVSPLPLKSFLCIKVTSVPWHVNVKHEPETVWLALVPVWVAAWAPWQLSHVAPPSAMTSTTVESADWWQVAHEVCGGIRLLPWQALCWQSSAVPAAELTIGSWTA